MSAVPPPPPVSPPPTPAGAPAPLVVEEPPPALVNLTPGSRIAARIVAQLPQGQIRLAAAFGEFTARGSLPVPQGTGLTLILQTTTPRVVLRPSPVVPDPEGSAPGLSVPSGKGVPVGRSVTGAVSVHGPSVAAAGAAPSAPQALGLAPGLILTATLARPARVPTGPFRAEAAATASAGPSGRPAATPPFAALPGTAARFPVRILAVQPPAPGPAAPATAPSLPSGRPQPGQTVMVTVVGSAPSGRVIAEGPIGTLSLPLEPVPAGTRLRLEVLAPRTQAAAPGPAPWLAAPSANAGAWPALNDALSALARSEPTTAGRVVNAILPKPGPQLAAEMLFFLAALRGGEVRGWLGDAATGALRRLRPELLQRLDEDFGELARVAREPTSGEWRVVHVPLSSGAQVDPFRLFLRDARGGAGDGDGDKGRFILDVALSRLGRIQLDGMVRDRGKRLELVVRTERPLPSSMREDIRRLFRESGETTGLRGSVGFQADPPGFFEPPAVGPAGPKPELIV